MLKHLKASLWLLFLTVVVCCVLYPLVLLGIGQTLFRDKADGSLIYNKDGQAVGSRLIAQPFTADKYFHPRPSFVSYNASASGASNWGASNPALRKRVEAALGPVLKYSDGRPVGPDIVAWVKSELAKDRGTLAKWTAGDSGLAETWAGSDSAVTDFLTKWQKTHGKQVAHWRETNPGTEIAPKDVAALFFDEYVHNPKEMWPETNGSDLQIAFFNQWWSAHPKLKVQPVPADMVMASGSGLDPHITLGSAMYQVDRVASARAAESKQDHTEVRQQIVKMLQTKAEAPLNGSAGVPLVNVLEINLALDDLK